MNKQTRKEQALKYLAELDVYKPYIDGFEQHDHVCVFERYAGFWVYQYPEIEKRMRAIEKEYKCTVYAITHEFTQFGECYSFLTVVFSTAIFGSSLVLLLWNTLASALTPIIAINAIPSTFQPFTFFPCSILFSPSFFKKLLCRKKT